MKELVIFIVIFILVTGVVAMVVWGGLYYLEKNITCPNFGKAVNLPTKYNFWAGGCFVEFKEGEWIPKRNYQGVNIK